MGRDISVNFYENTKKNSFSLSFLNIKLEKDGGYFYLWELLAFVHKVFSLSFLPLSIFICMMDRRSYMFRKGIYILWNWKANNSVEKSLVHCLGNRRKLWMSFQQGNFSFRFILLWLIFDFGWNNNIWVLADYLYNSSKMNFIQKYAWSLYTVQ